MPPVLLFRAAVSTAAAPLGRIHAVVGRSTDEAGGPGNAMSRRLCDVGLAIRSKRMHDGDSH